MADILGEKRGAAAMSYWKQTIATIAGQMQRAGIDRASARNCDRSRMRRAAGTLAPSRSGPAAARQRGITPAYRCAATCIGQAFGCLSEAVERMPDDRFLAEHQAAHDAPRPAILSVSGGSAGRKVARIIQRDPVLDGCP
ncbi:hypothetical protein [Mesorhizobium sp. SARCC-RB16n]|uniref:hypothetical protein n=1 Tax=Mesorhizobium sp. SARCC-RB16n TaxID=2116687 RepID=UPI00122EFBCA|nr:hypothetical protein [Mesorhizobium sp. SARCC-RB16n]